MSIRKRKWQTKNGEGAAWIVDYSDQRGARHQKTFGRKKDAEAFRDNTAIEVRHGLHVPDRDTVTVADAGSLWIEACKDERLERSTIESYESTLNTHIIPLIGHVKLSEINVPFVRSFKEELRVTKYPADFIAVRMRGKTRSASTIKRATTYLGALLGDAQERGTVIRNAVHEMAGRKKGRAKGLRRQKKVLQVGVDIPTVNEVGLILRSSVAHRVLLLTAALVGLRGSELRGLPWRLVDLKNGVIRVRQRADKYNCIGLPKTSAGNRDIPIPPRLVEELRKWKKTCPASALDLVFPTSNGNIDNHQNIVNRGFKAAQIAAGVTVDKGRKDTDGRPILEAKYSGLHALRHFYASWCINRREDGGLGLPAKVVQYRMGHSSIQVTMDTYGHLFPGTDDHELLEAAEKILLAIPDATKLQHDGLKPSLKIIQKPEK